MSAILGILLQDEFMGLARSFSPALWFLELAMLAINHASHSFQCILFSYN